MWNNAKSKLRLAYSTSSMVGLEEASPDGEAPPPGKPPGIPPSMPPALMVQLGNDGVADFFQLFLLMFKFLLLCNLVLIKPVDDFTLVKNLLFVLIVDLALKFFTFNSCFHVEYIGFKQILGRYLVLLLVEENVTTFSCRNTF